MNSIPALRVFVTDDEAPARRRVLRFLREEPGVRIVGEAANGPDTISGVRETKPDLLFLDIQMPGMDGFGVVDALEDAFLPRIIFVTAYDEYALRALQIHAFDYLLKPFDQARFCKAMTDVRRQHQKEPRAELLHGLRHLVGEVRPQRHPRLLVEENGRGTLLTLNQIDWAEADRNYVKLYIAGRAYTVRGTIESIAKRVDPEQFLRLNRSSVVRIDFIQELQRWTHGEFQVILRSGQRLIWTRRYMDRKPELICRL